MTLVSRREGEGRVTAIGKVPHYQHRDCIMIMMNDTERDALNPGVGVTLINRREGGKGDSNRDSLSLSTH